MMKQKQTAKQLKQKKNRAKKVSSGWWTSEWTKRIEKQQQKQIWTKTQSQESHEDDEAQRTDEAKQKQTTELNNPKPEDGKVLRILLQIEQNNTKNKITLKN